MIVLTLKQQQKNNIYKLKQLIRDIYPNKNYVKIKDNVIIIKNSWFSWKKDTISIKSFCNEIVPSVMCRAIELSNLDEDATANLVKQFLKSQSSSYSQYTEIDVCYRDFNLLMSILHTTVSSFSTNQRQIKTDSVYDIIRVVYKPKHVRQKEQEIHQLVKRMKKSLIKTILYLPDRIDR